MKKLSKLLISLFLFTALSASSYARIIVQGNADLPGIVFTFTAGDTSELPSPNPDFEFRPISGISTAVNWEFDTDNVDNPWHYYVGCGAGFEIYGLDFVLNGGLSYKLKELKHTTMELQGEISAGLMIEIFGTMEFYYQDSISLVFCQKNRRGVYYGVGLTSILIPTIYSSGEGTIFWLDGGVSGKVFAGVRI